MHFPRLFVLEHLRTQLSACCDGSACPGKKYLPGTTSRPSRLSRWYNSLVVMPRSSNHSHRNIDPSGL